MAGYKMCKCGERFVPSENEQCIACERAELTQLRTACDAFREGVKLYAKELGCEPIVGEVWEAIRRLKREHEARRAEKDGRR